MRQPAASAAAAPAKVDPRVAKVKSAAAADIKSQAMFDLGQQMTDMVFSFGELGFQEFETMKYLTGILEQHGFTIERGVAGIPTAWVAKWGSGKPVIALGSDVDCIPQASQKPGVAYHAPMIEGAPGHGEGHNSGTPLNIIAAIAAKRVMEKEKLPGTIVIWPGVAEEQLGTKAYYVRAGLFKDVDVVLYNHVGSNLSTRWGDSASNGLISVEYKFEGETAHSAGAPWRGKSALDAVELMNAGWNYRREHLRLQQRSHYVITDGGDQPNVVPRTASVWYYFRETTFEGIKNLWAIGDKMAEGASMMTDTTLHLARARLRVAVAHESHARRNDAHQHRRHGTADVDGSGRAAGEGDAARAGVPETGLVTKISRSERPRGNGRQRKARRRLRRHRRHFVVAADGVAEFSGEFPGGAGSQLGERDRDGHADRAQGRQRRRAGAGADGARPGDASRAGEAGARILRQRADEEPEVSAAAASTAISRRST